MFCNSNWSQSYLISSMFFLFHLCFLSCSVLAKMDDIKGKNKSCAQDSAALYLRPFSTWVGSAFDLLHCLFSGVLVWARYKHRPDVLDQSWKEAEKHSMTKLQEPKLFSDASEKNLATCAELDGIRANNCWPGGVFMIYTSVQTGEEGRRFAPVRLPCLYCLRVCAGIPDFYKWRLDLAATLGKCAVIICILLLKERRKGSNFLIGPGKSDWSSLMWQIEEF